jgi:hypothetical protein
VTQSPQESAPPPAERGSPVACCPRDGTPLVFTFEMPQKEFYCMECGGWFEFLEPRGKPPTPELVDAAAQLAANFRAGARAIL